MSENLKKILIVDDEPSILMSLEFLFRKKGYEVYIARNGNEALDILKVQKPMVAILDIMMPDVDGYEVCEYIKTSKEHLDTKVIFLSAKSKKTDIDKGYSSGADLYMTKPFSTRELSAKVAEMMN